MNTVLLSVIAFALALGILIAVHEFGHFWVARRMGVKVLRFSIGFGKPLWRWRRGADNTEYVIAALPLGGYVKMVDEREGPVAEEDLPRAFNRQPLGARAAIVAAGPVFNLAFAVFAYWLMFVVGVTGSKPVIGEVTPGSYADLAGLRAGEQIVAVDGRETPTWEMAVLGLLRGAMDREIVTVDARDVAGEIRMRSLDLRRAPDLMEGARVLEKLGIAPLRPQVAPVIGRLESGGAAEQAGLATGDRIVAADGRSMDSWDDWAEYVRSRPDWVIEVSVDRGGQSLTLEVRPRRVDRDGEEFGYIGAAADVPEEVLSGLRAEVKYGPAEAIGASVRKTWEMSALTLQMLWKMLVGEASVKNISGPVSIAQFAGQSASVGLSTFLAFLAIVSVSLAVLNLLPIPVLDGGHLMYYLMELVKGTPVSEHAQMVGQRLGIAVLLVLMGLAFYNDLTRLFG